MSMKQNINQFDGAESLWRSCQSLSCSTILQHLMEPEGSLSRSQELSTGLYPESDESSPITPAYFSKTRFNIILLPTSRSS
jgi:hypothetical protein